MQKRQYRTLTVLPIFYLSFGSNLPCVSWFIQDTTPKTMESREQERKKEYNKIIEDIFGDE